MKGHSSLQFSLSQWVAMFLFPETERAELFLSQLTEASCYLLETRSSQLNFSVILLLLFFLLLLLTAASPHWKVKAAAKYVEVPVSLLICLLFYYSPCPSQSVSIFLFPSAFKQSKPRMETKAAWKCKAAALCIQSCFFLRLSSHRVKHVWTIKRVFIPYATLEPKISQQA